MVAETLTKKKHLAMCSKLWNCIHTVHLTFCALLPKYHFKDVLKLKIFGNVASTIKLQSFVYAQLTEKNKSYSCAMLPILTITRVDSFSRI